MLQGNFAEYVERIKAGGITGDIINQLYEQSAERRATQRKLFGRYEGDKTCIPIYDHAYLDEDGKVEKDLVVDQLANDFFSEIVDDKVGFLVGNKIQYQLDKSAYSDTAPGKMRQWYNRLVGKEAEWDALLESHRAIIQEFVKDNDMADMDTETVKVSAICGEVYRLFYTADAKLWMRKLLPYDVVAIASEDVAYPEFALWFRQVASNEPGKMVLRCRFYDSSECQEYQQETDKTWSLVKKEPHYLSACPIIGFKNNDERRGDAENVLSLIDDYDLIMSVTSEDIRQYRQAYPYISGATIDKSFKDNLKANRVIAIDDANGKAGFLVKDINIAANDSMMDRLRKNISRFSKHVDYSDENYAGNITGVALRQKRTQSENKCKVTALKHSTAYRQMFRIACAFWAIKLGVQIDPNNIEPVYTFNYPKNILEDAQVQQALDGRISRETRLGLFPEITDPAAEVKKMEAEGDLGIQLTPSSGMPYRGPEPGFADGQAGQPGTKPDSGKVA